MSASNTPFWPFGDIAAQQMSMGLAAMDAGMAMFAAPDEAPKPTSKVAAPKARGSAARAGSRQAAQPKTKPSATGKRASASVRSAATSKPTRRSSQSWYRPIQKTPVEAWSAAFGMDDPKHPMAPVAAQAQLAEQAMKFWGAAAPLMATAAKSMPVTATPQTPHAMPSPFSNPMAPFFAAMAPTMGDTAFTFVDSWLDASRPKATGRRKPKKPDVTLTREYMTATTSKPCVRELPERGTARSEPGVQASAVSENPVEAATQAMMSLFDPFGLLAKPAASNQAAHAQQSPAATRSGSRAVATQAKAGRSVANPAVAHLSVPAPASLTAGDAGAPIPLLTAQYHPPMAGAGGNPWGFITIALAVPPRIGNGLPGAI